MNTTNTVLTLEQKEELTDKLLNYMKIAIENMGRKISLVSFNFTIAQKHQNYIVMDAKDGEDYKCFKEQYEISDEEIDIILKSCIANEYIEGRIYELKLTRQGWARANSVEKAKLYKPNETGANYNFHGTVNLTNSQIGNNNQLQNHIQNDLENLLKFIENSNSTQQEKNTAKNLLLAFIKHPLVTTAFGTTLSTFIKSHFGG